MSILQQNPSNNNPSAWRQLARSGRIAAAIEAYIDQYRKATFAAVQRALEAYIDVRGERSLTEDDPNAVMWLGMSDPLADAFLSLINTRRLHVRPTHWMVYLHDGCVPKLPLGKSRRRRPYAKPHWVPLMLLAKPVDGALNPLTGRAWDPAREPGGQR